MITADEIKINAPYEATLTHPTTMVIILLKVS